MADIKRINKDFSFNLNRNEAKMLKKINNMEIRMNDYSNEYEEIDYSNVAEIDEMNKKKSGVSNFFSSVGATVATFGTSILEGIGVFGEGIVDSGMIVASIFDSKPKEIMGDSVATDSSREKWMDRVKKENVKDYFDNNLYNKTNTGKWMRDYSFGFDKARTMGETLGILAGAAIVGVAVGGVAFLLGGPVLAIAAGAAVGVLAVSIVGQLTSESWNNGASYSDGISDSIETAIDFASDSIEELS